MPRSFSAVFVVGLRATGKGGHLPSLDANKLDTFHTDFGSIEDCRFWTVEQFSALPQTSVRVVRIHHNALDGACAERLQRLNLITIGQDCVLGNILQRSDLFLAE